VSPSPSVCASCGDRHCRIVAEADRLVVQVQGLRDLWSLRRNAEALRLLARPLQRAGMGLAVQIGAGRPWPILPRPHILARWFLPTLDESSIRT
jgi:hypothetical protein